MSEPIGGGPASADTPQDTVDLVLSSGFLAFAGHAGFLQAIEDAGLRVGALCGTSSGSMAGAMWSAGHSSDAIARELSAQAPIRLFRLSWTPWRGLFLFDKVVERMRDLLPPTFAGLDKPFAVGVMGKDRSHRLLTSGPLPEAVAASCAIPWVFRPVTVDGTPWQDGGFVDRLGVDAFREWRGSHPTIVHMVARSGGAVSTHDLSGMRVVRTPRSGAKFWNLGDFAGQREAARAITADVLNTHPPAG